MKVRIEVSVVQDCEEFWFPSEPDEITLIVSTDMYKRLFGKEFKWEDFEDLPVFETTVESLILVLGAFKKVEADDDETAE